MPPEPGEPPLASRCSPGRARPALPSWAHRAPGRRRCPPLSQDSRCAAASSRLCRDFLSSPCGRFRSAKPAMLSPGWEGRARARQRARRRYRPSGPRQPGHCSPALPGRRSPQRRPHGECLAAVCSGRGKAARRSLGSQAGAVKEIPRGSFSGNSPRALRNIPPSQGSPRPCRSPQLSAARSAPRSRRVPTRWSGSPAPVKCLSPAKPVQLHLSLANKNQTQYFLFTVS